MALDTIITTSPPRAFDKNAGAALLRRAARSGQTFLSR